MFARRPASFIAVAVLLSLSLAALPARAESPDLSGGSSPDDGRPYPRVETSFRPAFGAASLVLTGPGGQRVEQNGVALVLRTRNRVSRQFSADVVVTWGLTDWDRAREWIDAGNRAGTWTTDKIQAVTHWVEDGGDSQGLRLMGAVFADMFLVMSYAAVPFCYAGSVGGATSHLQIDVTGNYHLGDGTFDLWGEAGLGVAGLPVRFAEWDYAAGPVVGVGLDAGPFRVGARVLWSPAAFHSATRSSGDLYMASLTFGLGG
jgi:hypothetical protein